MKLELCYTISGVEAVLATGTVDGNGQGRIDTRGVPAGTIANRLYIVDDEGNRQHLNPTDGPSTIRRWDGQLEWEIITNGGIVIIDKAVEFVLTREILYIVEVD